MIKILITSFTVLFSFLCFSQNISLTNQWYSIGPEELPSPNSNASAKGIGPIEFIRTTRLEKGLLLAGSLSGGLFYSTDGGEYWLNSGSDNWTYGSSTWADFHPENQNFWFACSHETVSKDGVGNIGYYGGIHRTLDRGITWDLIGNFDSFGKGRDLKIYKTVFDPINSKKLYVLTSKGLYFTTNCLADEVKWQKFKNSSEEVYDLIFIGDKMLLSTKKNNEWVLNINGKLSSSFSELNPKNVDRFTFAKDSINLYLLIDYKSGSDMIYKYNYMDDKFTQISRSQRVVFGSGRVFEVNPHDTNEIYVGVSVRLRKWNILSSKFENLSSNYHVDVEFVTFDPFDENLIYMANHGGVYISYNKGKSWESKSKGLGVAEVMGMSVGKSDPNQVVIGTYHDGSSMYANWDNDGKYYWKNVNGGDGLIPLINPNNNAEVYTSNQYNGGGLYYSNDSSKTVSNIHSKNNIKTSGWGGAAKLHPIQTNFLFFNGVHKIGSSKGNSDVFRTGDASIRNSAKQISNFKQTHGLSKYYVFGIYTSDNHPNVLLAYVLNYYKNEKGDSKIEHLLFRTHNSLDSTETLIKSWHELELPRNDWLADVEIDPTKINKMYSSFVFGKVLNKAYPEEVGVVYLMKYRKKNNKLKKSLDVSSPLVNGRAGKHNLIYSSKNDKLMFIGTMNGVFVRKKVLFWWGTWKKVGFGLPHCAVYGMDYNETNHILTVGLRGRGVWKISIEEED